MDIPFEITSYFIYQFNGRKLTLRPTHQLKVNYDFLLSNNRGWNLEKLAAFNHTKWYPEFENLNLKEKRNYYKIYEFYDLDMIDTFRIEFEKDPSGNYRAVKSLM